MGVGPDRLEGRIFWGSNVPPIFANREREAFFMPLHAHDFVEIQYVAEGRGYHYIGDERLRAAQGDLFIIPVGTRHVYRPSSQSAKDELIVYNCLFDPSVPDLLGRASPLPNGVADLLAGGERPYRRFRDTDGEARDRMLTLHRELQSRRPGYEAVLYACLTELLIALYRLSLRDSAAASASAAAASDAPFAALSPRLEATLRYIEEQCCNRALTLAEAAARVPVSGSHLQRLLKQATGQTFTEYVQNARIARSRELLRHTALSVQEVAGSVGYRDMKFFHALFRRKTGMSPKQYRMRGWE